MPAPHLSGKDNAFYLKMQAFSRNSLKFCSIAKHCDTKTRPHMPLAGSNRVFHSSAVCRNARGCAVKPTAQPRYCCSTPGLSPRVVHAFIPYLTNTLVVVLPWRRMYMPLEGLATRTPWRLKYSASAVSTVMPSTPVEIFFSAVNLGEKPLKSAVKS